MRTRGYFLLTAASLSVIAGPSDASETVKHKYDSLGRLIGTSTTGTVNNGAASTLTYDAAGNRKTYVISGSAGAPPPPGGPAPLGSEVGGVSQLAAPATAPADPASCSAAEGATPIPADTADTAEPCL